MSDDFTPFNRAVFIGIGLIGSSLARVMRRDGLAREIIAVARRQETLDTVRRLALADETLSDPAAAVAGADLVIIGTPLGAYEAIGRAIAPALAPGAIVTDVGSTKQSAMRDLGRHLPGHVHFVPGHPLAGTEHSGPESGFETLFEGRWCILTPDPATDRTAVRRISDLWQRAGMMVEEMSAAHHDVVLAITSHLPHLIAYTIVGTADDLEEHTKSEVIKFAASGFRDFTRIAASDPVMWRDIFLNNREAVLDILGRFSEDLSVLQRAIRDGNGALLEETFRRTREIRRGVVAAKQDVPPRPVKNA
ncbi:MAG: prephenate/arogenate dehydrogenase family protein [Alphaproteobacteria bacterium]